MTSHALQIIAVQPARTYIRTRVRVYACTCYEIIIGYLRGRGSANDSAKLIFVKATVTRFRPLALE